MTPPPTIPFSSVDRSGRARSEYNGIEQLAQSVLDNGLIQPLVLVPLRWDGYDDVATGLQTTMVQSRQVFGLDAGGRRSAALDLLLSEGSWDGILHHATTCLKDPLRPGYILKGEEYSDELSRIQTEIAENLDRDEMPWRDLVPRLVKAWKLAQTDAHSQSRNILMRDYGAALGCGYMDLQAAVKIHEDLVANPERYKDVTSIRGAYAKLLKVNEVEMTKVLALRSMQNVPKLAPVSSSVQIQSEPGQIREEKPSAVIPLTTAFVNCDSLDFMEKLPSPTFDHIVTDPDYAVSRECLEANMDTQAGVHQDDVNSSLLDLYRFIELSWKCIKDQGFLVFWYDLDHHEKIQNHARSVGFAVQRWPLIWIKSDYLSNAAPAYNFTKNIEYAMVCRKPNAVLSQVQKFSTFNCATGDTVKIFNHPFAKPLDVSKWIFNAISIKGQTTYDPFLGSGAIAVAAAQLGLRPVGSEINPDHYHNALVNLQNGYRKILGNVTFS